MDLSYYFRVVAFGAMLLPLGCETEVKIGASEIPADDGLFVLTCETMQCTKAYTVNSADLQNCFGYSTVTPIGWGPSTPTEVQGHCDPPPPNGQDCEISVLSGHTLPLNNTCGCWDAFTLGDGCDCCTYPTLEEGNNDNTWVDAGSDLLDALEDCGIYPDEPEPDCGELDLEECGDVDLEAPCGPEHCDGFSTPNALADLVIDGDGSYLSLDNGVYSDQVALIGAGSIADGPTRFMRGIAFAQDVALGGDDLDGWILWFSEPIAMDQTGNDFVIPADEEPYFRGWGQINGNYKDATFWIGEDADGSLHPSTMTWDLEYEETTLAGTVTVHLEGSYTQL